MLDLLAQGRSNVDLAKHLSVSLKTVQNYIANICNKLQVADRTQAVIRARDAGLGESGVGARPYEAPAEHQAK